MALTAEEDKRFYVYHLVDPRNGCVFYVGKGTGPRFRQHVRDAKRGKIDNAPKYKRIREILDAGYQVEEKIVLRGLSESAAFRIEGEQIRQMRNEGLTNISGGSVSNAERAHQQALAAIARIKSFDEWIRSATVNQMRAAARLGPGGSARGFRDQLVGHLQEVADMTAPRLSTS